MKNIFLVLFYLSLFHQTLLALDTTQKVSIQFKWKHAYQFIGYYAALEKGFYKDEGLDVTLKELSFDDDYIDEVIDGRSQYGVSDASLVIRYLNNNPVVLLAQIYQHSPLIFLSLKDSNITTPADMIGKKVMYNQKKGDDAPLTALLHRASGDLRKIDISNFTSLQDFIDKKVDVSSAYSINEPYTLQKRGIAFNIIDPKSYGIDLYGDNFFTSKKELKEHPDRVAKMIKATLKGWHYALSHQDEMIDLMLKKYTPTQSRDALLYSAKGIYEMIMPTLTPLGYFDKQNYLKTAKLYQQESMVNHADIEDDFYYHDSTHQLSLSADEKAWLKDHPAIKIAVMDFWESDSQNNNIHTDLIKLLNKYGNLHIIPVKFNAWREGYNEAIKGEYIDGIANLSWSSQREKLFLYTKVYNYIPHYLIVNKDETTIHSLQDLNNKTVYLKEKIIAHQLIKDLAQNINIIDLKTDDDIYRKLSSTNEPAATISYSVKKADLQKYGLKIVKKAYGKYGQIFIGISKRHPELQSIINKVYQLIPVEELTKLQNKSYTTSTGLVKLTKQEQVWLIHHPVATFTGDPDWLPFEAFDKNGNYIGIVSDFLKEIEQVVTLTFKPQVVHSWSETLQKAQNNAVDIISGDIDDPILSKNYKPITPYFKTPVIIIMDQKFDFVNDLEDIKDKKIAIIKGYGYTSQLYKHYPAIHFIEVNNVQNALQGLIYHNYDAVLLSIPAAGFMLSSKGYSTLKIVGKTSVEMKPTLFVTKNKPQLFDIIQKTMDSLDHKKIASILGKWHKVEFAQKTDYTLVYQLSTVFLLFVLASLYWHRRLSNEIKKRKQSEHAMQMLNTSLTESESQMRTLLDNIPLQIIVSNYDGDVLMVNPQTIKDYALQADRLAEYKMQDYYLHPKERDSILYEVKTKGFIKDTIVKIKRPDGTIHSMLISILPFLYKREEALLSIALDLTERLQIEEDLAEAKREADNANKAKSEFLANMSHEIRTPMNAVIGFSELLASQITNPVQKDYVDSILKGGNTLLDIINDILDLSKIEAGKLLLSPENVDLRELAHEMQTIFDVKLVQKDLQFSLEIDDDLPKYLWLDSTRIRQILLNLIGNAIKFTHQGGIKLIIKKQAEEKAKKRIDIQMIVEDSGIGIPKEEQENIFNAFEQQNKQDLKIYGGTGLGLAICKKLTEMMHGTLTLESAVDQGSKFAVLLPDITISNNQSGIQSTEKTIENIQFEKASILIVDDAPDNRKLIKEILKPYHFILFEAENGMDAIEQLLAQQIDLVLMDIKMPVMNGYEAIKIIKKDKNLAQIPILALTAFALDHDIEKIEAYQFDGFLRKPIYQDDLLILLEKFLPHKTTPSFFEQNEVLDKKAYPLLSEMVARLERDQMTTFQDVKNSGDFTRILTFAHNLEEIAKEYKNNLLSAYAQELITYAKSFDIDRVNFMLNNFPKFIEKLKKIML